MLKEPFYNPSAPPWVSGPAGAGNRALYGQSDRKKAGSTWFLKQIQLFMSRIGLTGNRRNRQTQGHALIKAYRKQCHCQPAVKKSKCLNKEKLFHCMLQELHALWVSFSSRKECYHQPPYHHPPPIIQLPRASVPASSIRLHSQH